MVLYQRLQLFGEKSQQVYQSDKIFFVVYLSKLVNQLAQNTASPGVLTVI